MQINVTTFQRKAVQASAIGVCLFAAWSFGSYNPQPPLDSRPRGSRPAMSDQDMEDLEAFLRTLNDDDVAAAAELAHPTQTTARADRMPALLHAPGWMRTSER